MRPRISEVRKIAALLEAEHEDVESLAALVVQEAFDMCAARDKYVVVMRDNKMKEVFIFGVFDTKNKASKAIGTTITPTTVGETSFGIWRMVNVQS